LDEDATDETLRQLSEMPVSVVIVGIGKGNFADLTKFCNRKRPNKQRTNIQFHEYKEYQQGDAMAEAIINEVGNQFNTFIG